MALFRGCPARLATNVAGPACAADEEAVTKLANSTSSYILYNYSGGFSWYLFGPDNRLQYDIAGTLGNGGWGYIVGTYDKDAGANNQRLYLNGARVAQMSDTLPIDLNSATLGIGRHVSGIADPFNGHIDEFRIAHVQRSDGWIETTWNNMSDPGAFAAAGAEEQEGGEPPLLAGAGGSRLPHGLTIARLLVVRLGGRLEIPIVTGGTRCIVTIPRPMGASTSASHVASVPVGGSKLFARESRPLFLQRMTNIPYPLLYRKANLRQHGRGGVDRWAGMRNPCHRPQVGGSGS